MEAPSPERLRNLAQWLQEPLSQIKEQELNNWLVEDPDRQLKWDRLTRFNLSAKQLQIVPTDVGLQWEALRDDLGFKHSTSKKSNKHRSKSRKRGLLKTPSVIAILSMAIFSLFLLVLYLVRQNSAF